MSIRTRVLIGAAVVLLFGGFLCVRSFAALLPLHTDIARYKNDDLRPAAHTSRQMMQLAMQVEKRENFPPATAARLYSYTASIYADTLAKTSSATTSAAATVLLLDFLSPKDQEFLDNAYLTTFGTYPFVDAGSAQLLAAYEARTKADHFNLQWSPTMIPSGPYWYVRNGKADGGAMAGEWMPWILATSSASVPPPPTRGSVVDSLELAKIQYAVDNRSTDDLPAISFWQGSSGFTKGVNHDNISPAGVWQNILSVEEGSSLSDAEYAQAQKILAQSMADSFIYTWQVKYKYYVQRPSMRIADLNLAIADPPFPSYVSGHSTVSATVAVVLSALFPDKQKVWTALYHDARYSRLDAGIHFDVDNAAGYSYGGELGDEILKSLGVNPVLAISTPYQPTGPISSLFQLASFSVANFFDSLHLSAFVKSVPRFFTHLFARGLSSDSARVHFTDITAAAGLTYQHATSTAALPSTDGLNDMAGGITMGDVNRDGWPDLYVTHIDTSGTLYENMKDGTFKDITKESGVDTTGFSTNGALFADLNNDGWPDLYVTTIGATRNLLFMNDGAGHFTREGVARGAVLGNSPTHTGQSVAAGDYNGDGYLDLFVDDWRPSETGPGFLSDSALLKNGGAGAPGYFTDVTKAAGIDLGAVPPFGVFAISSAFADLDGDGWPDLAIAGDFGTSQLYWNSGDGTFVKGTADAGVGTEENGMGSALGDYNGDGLLDWFVTSIYNADPPCKGTLPDCLVGWSGNRLYTNAGGRTFTDTTDKSGVRDGGWGWGASWLDADNDGKPDLVMANGFVFGPDEQAMAKSLPSYADDPMRFWYNNGDGAMSEIAVHAGLTNTALTTGLATLDFNNDGRTDIAVVDNNGKLYLYRNDSSTDNGWLKVQVLTAPNGRDALGAVVQVQTVASSTEQTQQIGVNSSFHGQSETTVTFGLGAGTAPVASVTVEWPWLKKTRTYTNVARDTTLVATPQD